MGDPAAYAFVARKPGRTKLVIRVSDDIGTVSVLEKIVTVIPKPVPSPDLDRRPLYVLPVVLVRRSLDAVRERAESLELEHAARRLERTKADRRGGVSKPYLRPSALSAVPISTTDGHGLTLIRPFCGT